MSAIAPFAASSFAPEERPQQLSAKEARRTGRHEPIRSSTSRIATRGAGLGVTMAAGVAAGINYLEHDLQLSLLAGGQVGTVAAGMAFVGAWTERRRMTRIARAASGLAVQLTADGTPADEAAAKLLALRGADQVALEQAARDTAGNPETGRALGLLGRVAVLRALL
ncbi:MAG TPA: hypothetical protein VHS79_22720 [Actinomycetes bacterium]|jgi:hypothetical protein|nr:hypothetical protein [Actinomycetes bacterium]